MNFEEKFDLVVVGGGPAGSVSAKTAAEKGGKTLLLEKDRDFGIPVRCAEGIGLEYLSLFIEPSNKWIDNSLEKVRMHAPNGKEVHIYLGEQGAIVNRKVFDFELALLASKHGAHVRNRCCVTMMQRENGGLRLEFEHYGKKYTVKAPLVIGADGVESRIGRWAGLKTNIPPIDIESSFQYVLHHKNIDVQYCDFFFGEYIAPGGYIWVFPKGENLANVGIGVAASRTKNRSAKELLDDFVSKNFPGASQLSSIAGAVPAAKAHKQIIADNVMLAGDAASQVNPLTGGGIMSSMWGGRFAGLTAVEALSKGVFSKNSLAGYPKAYHKKVGETYDRHYRIKQAVHKLPDEVLNRTADLLLDIPLEQRTLRKIFQFALVNEPGLVIDIIKAFFG